MLIKYVFAFLYSSAGKTFPETGMKNSSAGAWNALAFNAPTLLCE
jgi:hypothetical protein